MVKLFKHSNSIKNTDTAKDKGFDSGKTNDGSCFARSCFKKFLDTFLEYSPKDQDLTGICNEYLQTKVSELKN